MSLITLQKPSDAVIKRAEKIVAEDKVQEIDTKNYRVLGSTGIVYDIEYDERHGLICKNYEEQNEHGLVDKYKLCPAWRMSHNPKICKHCWAVILFKQNQEKKN